MIKNVKHRLDYIYYQAGAPMRSFRSTDIRELLNEAIDSIFADGQEFLSNPGKDFSRIRKISFRDAMIFPMVTAGDSTIMEMINYFPLEKLPQQASLSYRRSQLKASAFFALFKRFVESLTKSDQSSTLDFIAVDGTTLNTPYNPKDH